MCRGGIGAGLRKRFLNIRENREDPVHIQRPISPFTVGVKLYLGPSGAADKQGFQLCIVKYLGRISFCPPLDHKSTGSGSDGRRHRGAGHGCETSSGRRAEHIDSRCCDIRLYETCTCKSPAGVDEQAVIVCVESRSGQGHLRRRGRSDGGVGVRSQGSSPHCCCWNTH